MRKVSHLALIGALFAPGWASAQPEAPPSPSPPPAQPAPTAPGAERPPQAPAGTTRPEAPAPPPEAEPPAAPRAPVEPRPPDAGEQQPAPGAPTPPSTTPPPAPPPSTAPPPGEPPPAELPDPEADAQELQTLGEQRGAGQAQVGLDGTGAPLPPPAPTTQVFAEDWWTHARPILEFHGYFRTRAELFHKFHLGRIETPRGAIWSRPPDNRYAARNQEEFGPELCTGAETDRVASESESTDQLYSCDNNTQSGANLRLRLNPEIHVSDNLRIRSQIDLLDNLVLGSTPEGLNYGVEDADGLEVSQRSGYNQLGFYDNTVLPPDSSSNGFSDSVRVKRAWGEYGTPVGELRFGRMPHHWGMGMLYNAGDGYDDDYQSTIDRLSFLTSFQSLDLTIGISWDFPNEGASGSVPIPGAQPYDRASLDDVNQYTLTLLRRKSEELEKLHLARGDVLLNGGLYFLYRSQTFANDQPLPASEGGTIPGANLERQADAFARRDAEAFVPDLWLQLLYKQFRFEAELATVLGSIGSTSIEPNSEETFRTSPRLKLRQWGLATELEQKLVENRLRLGFHFGWGTGDPDAFDPTIPGNLIPGPNEQQINDDTISTFRFHPSYRVDLILNRNILQRIQGSYYFRPSVEYDFVRDPSGQRAGGGFQVIWTRASEFIQTPGHDADLGLELNGTLYYQAKDGALNDSPDAMGGFYSALQYGVLFPLAGMGYQSAERRELPGDNDVSTAQILRLYLGILF